METLLNDIKNISKNNLSYDIKFFCEGIYVLIDNSLPGGNLNYFLVNEILNHYENKGLINNKTKIICKEDIELSIAFANICASKGYELYVISKKVSIEDFLNFKILNSKIIFDNKNNINKYFNNRSEVFVINLEDCIDLIKEKIKEYLRSFNLFNLFKFNTIVIKSEASIISKIFVQEIKKHIQNIEVIGVYVTTDNTNFESLLNTRKIYDDFYLVDEKEGYENMIKLLKENNFYVGIKGAAAMKVALIHKNKNKDKKILVIIPDRMERYFSMVQYYQI